MRNAGLSVGITSLAAIAFSAGCSNNTAATSSQAEVTTTSPGWLSDTADLTPPPPGQYSPPEELPVLITVPDRSIQFAGDRWYSGEHIWVQPLGDDQFVLGASEKLVTLAGAEIAGVKITAGVGDIVNKDEVFGNLEAFKISIDMIMPLSGEVLQVNSITPTLIKLYPYTTGWLLVVKADEPGEIESLFGPKYYTYLNTPSPSGEVPDPDE